MHRLRSMATVMTAISMLVALIAIAVIVVGVLVVAQSTFERLMVEAGTPAADAQAMFDHAITGIFVAAVAVAMVVSAGLAVLLSALLARPMRQMANAARRIADGDYATRVPTGGPVELASLASSFVTKARIASTIVPVFPDNLATRSEAVLDAYASRFRARCRDRILASSASGSRP